MNNIPEIRKSRSWTQENLANEAKISRAHLACIERGKVNVKMETAEKIAFALGTTVDQLFYK